MSSIPGPASLIPIAAAAVTVVVERLPATAWSRPTPCARWDVRRLLGHLTAEHLWAPQLLRGLSVDQVGDRFDGDVLGDRPVQAWRRAIVASVSAWAAADTTRPVSTSQGPIPAGEYAHQMLLDLTVHGWDLARAAGLPYTPVPAAVADGLAYGQPMAEREGIPGLFAAPLPAGSPEAAPFERLLLLLGRDPGWSPPR